MIYKFYSPEELDYFSIYLGASEKNHKQEKITRPNGFMYHHLLEISEGEGIIILGGTSHQIKKGDLIYISQDVPHNYYGTTDNFQTNFLTFFGTGVNQLKSYYGIADYGIYRDKNTSNYEKHLDEIYNRAKASSSVATLCALTMSTVVDFFEVVCKDEISPIEAVRDYLETHYCEMLTLDDLLSFYPYSKSKLCSEFKGAYNMTIFEMITDMRLRKAQHMIKGNPCTPNQELATACGFHDVSYFCKMYKKKYGISPKEQEK